MSLVSGVGCTDRSASPEETAGIEGTAPITTPAPTATSDAESAAPQDTTSDPEAPILTAIEGVLREAASADGDERKRLLADAESRCAKFLTDAPDDLLTAAVCDQRVVILWQDGRRSGNLIRDTAMRSVTIRRRELPPQDHRTASSLSTLGTILLVAGDYAAAKPLFYEALEILEAHEETRPLELASCMNSLGGLFQEVGEHAEARRHFEGALAIRKRVLEPQDPRVVSTHINLGRLLHEMGMRADHRPTLEAARKSFAMAESGWTHESFQAPHQKSAGLNNYAYLLADLGEKALARSKLEEAIKIREQTWGEEHEDLAWSLGNLATLEEERAQFDTAEALRQRAVQIRRKAYKDSQTAPHISWDLRWLGIHFLRRGRVEEAVTYARQAEDVRREFLIYNVPRLSEEMALGAASEAFSGLDPLLSVACGTRSPSIVEAAWNEVVRSRAFVLDAMAARQRGIYEAGGKARLTDLIDALEAARKEVAEFLVRGVTSESGRRQSRDARRRREAAEEALAEASRPFRESLSRRSGSWTEIRSALPDGWALLSFVQFEHYYEWSQKDEGKRRESERAYAAFVLRERDAAPVIVPLGAAVTIDASCAAWLAELTRAAGLTSTALTQAEEALARRGAELRSLLWDPVSRHLEGADRVFVVPAAELNRIPLAALPTTASRYLLESGPLFHYLTTERDLLATRHPAETTGKALLTLGGADFDQRTVSERETSNATASPMRGIGQLKESGPGQEPAQEDDCLARRLRFSPLPGTREESEAVSQLWSHSPFALEGVTTLFGMQATEESLKELAPGHRMLHLATHGFFLRSASCTDEPGRRRNDASGTLSGEAPLPNANPLTLSGIALAGANARKGAGAAEDGLLLAQEIASLDLTGVELAVLSACETGLGAIERGEGVLGLRRAFQVAGVRSLVMALWTIDDTATTEWIRVFFRKLLVERLATPDAARAASLHLLDTGRRGGRTSHPFFWGGFVATGRWN